MIVSFYFLTKKMVVADGVSHLVETFGTAVSSTFVRQLIHDVYNVLFFGLSLFLCVYLFSTLKK